MGVIIFVRHGESTANVKGRVTDGLDGSPLTARGKAQAKRAGEELKKLKIARLLASPLRRAQQTAQIIGGCLDLKPETDGRLRERRFGELAGIKGEEWLEDVLLDRLGKHTEKWGEINVRVEGFVSYASKIDGITVVVTHEGFIRSALCRVLKLNEIQGFWIRMPNCGITAINCGKKREIIATGLPILPEGVVKIINRDARIK